ncbi:arginine--tRNA ligase [bacterium]|nr:MAG: arginine--tRNA ligase [bacterium TMED6]RCL87835.1 MAG: arginine--tRNA ligase [bacterium]|tara:strand:+ start:2448 stop:4079 length:1632 start_codon:yes stop_codon:yes gene_type:complete
MNNNFKKHINYVLDELKYPLLDINIQIPKQISHGDLTTNIAMLLAKELKLNPIEIANNIIKILKKHYSEYYQNISTAGPGFINVKLNKNIILELLKEIKDKNENYGKNKSGKGKNAIVEFVSANPTGPLTVAHGRGAIVGDTVSRILEWNGFNVDREYYFNNAGRQMRILGESVKSRYLNNCGIDNKFPENGYQGEYINDIAKSFQKKFKKDYVNEKSADVFKKYAEDKIFENIKNTLNTLGINFDNYFNEDDLYNNKDIDKTILDLDNKGLIYKKDNATWFAGTKVDRPVDRVLIKSTGEPTYRLPDMAYHRTKFERSYDKIIDIFGADHMDAYPDIMAAMNQLEYDIDKMKVLIHQFVTITENNKPIKMSTRKANFTTLQELCDEVSPEVVRYFFVMRNINSHLNFELEIAKDQSDANPIFYLQYAHARICTMLRKALDLDLKIDNDKNLILLNEDIENDLMNTMTNFPNIIKKSYTKLDPQIISNYLEDLASKFHKYYSAFRVITENKKLTEARLYLIDSMRIIIKNGLNLLGIIEKEKM